MGFLFQALARVNHLLEGRFDHSNRFIQIFTMKYFLSILLLFSPRFTQNCWLWSLAALSIAPSQWRNHLNETSFPRWLLILSLRKSDPFGCSWQIACSSRCLIIIAWVSKVFFVCLLASLFGWIRLLSSLTIVLYIFFASTLADRFFECKFLLAFEEIEKCFTRLYFAVVCTFLSATEHVKNNGIYIKKNL